MQKISKLFSYLAKAIGLLLTLVILAGFIFRLFAPEAKPQGEFVEMGAFDLHIHATGEKSHKPSLVIETGQALPGEHYHWLSEGLKDSLRVIRYDRAGIAYSDLSGTPRDPKTIAHELHELLEKSGESPPYILLGHSFGGLFIRVYTQLYPDEVEGMIFLDSSHPDQRERLNYPKQKDFSWILNTAAVLGDMGILGLFDRLNGSIFYVEDFPDEVNNRFHDYTLDGKYYRGYRDEIKWESYVYEQARETKDFGSLPIRVFTANKRYNGDEAKPEWIELQKEIAGLSTDGKHFLLNGHHNSVYTTKKNADIVCHEVLKLVKELGY
ncbi:MAG: alpha/beta hydrolase [Bacteroidia bacterium]|nr:alpha/beta hydrolase [Bacteroidia bacterium]